METLSFSRYETKTKVTRTLFRSLSLEYFEVLPVGNTSKYLNDKDWEEGVAVC